MTLKDLIYGKIVIPTFYFLNGDTRFYYFWKYKAHLNKTRAQIEEYQLKRLLKLINHAYDTVPYYKKLFDELNIKPTEIKSLSDLEKIPPLDKKTAIENLKEMKSTKKYTLIEEFSGGSTGNRMAMYKDKRYHHLSKGVLMRDLFYSGVLPGKKSVWIAGDIYRNKSTLHKYLHHIIDAVNRRLVFDTFKYSDEELENWIETKYNVFKPDYIFGFGGSLYQVAKLIKQKKIKIHKPKKIISSSERLEKREYIESVFGCKVIDQYGSTEIPTMAIEDEHYTMHSSDDFVIVEIGVDNEVILTALESYGMPLIRYKIGDIGFKNKKEQSKSNSPFKQFNVLIGRTYELMLNKKGERISGGLIKTQMEDEALQINEFQVVQKSIDEVDLNIVMDDAVKMEDVKRLEKILKYYLDCDEVKINYIKKFPTEANGKRIAFKCLI
jgi:phenylacetate-CoA ligase